VGKKPVKPKGKQGSAKAGKHDGLASIVIGPVSDAAAARTCLDAIQRETQYIRYEVVVVAALPLGDVAKPSGAVDLRVVGPRAAAACPLGDGIAEAQGDPIVLLDPAVTVQSRWLQALLKAVAGENVAVAGGRMTDPSGRIASAGIELDESAGFVPRMSGSAGSFFAALQAAKVDAVDFGLAILTRRGLEEVGPLDPSLDCWYAGIDFCLRAAANGLAVSYVPALLGVDSRGPNLTRDRSALSPEGLLADVAAFDRFYRKWRRGEGLPANRRTALQRYQSTLSRSLITLLEQSGVPDSATVLARADAAGPVV
jgi:hypothetical protein